MEEMIEICVPHVVEANKDMNEDSAIKMMMEFFPNSKEMEGVKNYAKTNDKK